MFHRQPSFQVRGKSVAAKLSIAVLTAGWVLAASVTCAGPPSPVPYQT